MTTQSAKFKELGKDMLLGPQPTEDDLAQLKQQGVKTVIDLRPPGETASPNEDMVVRSGLAYANVPVDKTQLSSGLVDQLDRALKQNEAGFLLHCATGARAAMLLALSRARRNQWSAARTFEEAKSMGFDITTSPEYSSFVARETRT
jgi:uncharacterized protein (TIGR01244 family)